jgi:hypothetical protein
MQFSISKDARRYAVQQLALRAGADASEWRLEVSDTATTIYLNTAPGAELSFPITTREFGIEPVRTIRC